jgi:hypothetical protein
MTGFAPSRWLRFIQTSPFLRKWASLDLDDDDLRSLELEIVAGPERHPIIKGTGGVRKVRFAKPGAGRGKSGAYRVCYAYFARRGMVFLLTAYAKDEQPNLTKAQQYAIAAVISEIEASIESGEIR